MVPKNLCIVVTMSKRECMVTNRIRMPRFVTQKCIEIDLKLEIGSFIASLRFRKGNLLATTEISAKS